MSVIENLVSIRKRLEKLGRMQLYQPSKIDVPTAVIISSYRIILVFVCDSSAPQGKRVYSKRHEKALWMSKSGKVGTVEEVALDYFTSRHGWRGVHSETSIITTLFGLLFWDILFDDTVPGVFWSDTQGSSRGSSIN